MHFVLLNSINGPGMDLIEFIVLYCFISSRSSFNAHLATHINRGTRATLADPKEEFVVSKHGWNAPNSPHLSLPDGKWGWCLCWPGLATISHSRFAPCWVPTSVNSPRTLLHSPLLSVNSALYWALYLLIWCKCNMKTSHLTDSAVLTHTNPPPMPVW